MFLHNYNLKLLQFLSKNACSLVKKKGSKIKSVCKKNIYIYYFIILGVIFTQHNAKASLLRYFIIHTINIKKLHSLS